MTARNAARVEASRRDPVRDQARGAAVRALANHQGVIRSLSAERRREIANMEAGPTLEVGRAPARR